MSSFADRGFGIFNLEKPWLVTIRASGSVKSGWSNDVTLWRASVESETSVEANSAAAYARTVSESFKANGATWNDVVGWVTKFANEDRSSQHPNHLEQVLTRTAILAKSLPGRPSSVEVRAISEGEHQTLLTGNKVREYLPVAFAWTEFVAWGHLGER